jgi:hypothetical protein
MPERPFFYTVLGVMLTEFTRTEFLNRRSQFLNRQSQSPIINSRDKACLAQCHQVKPPKVSSCIFEL